MMFDETEHDPDEKQEDSELMSPIMLAEALFL